MSIFYTNFTKRGDHILFMGYKDATRIKRKIKYKPSLFVKSPKPTKYMSHDNSIWLDKIQFNSIGEAYEFIEQYKEVPDYQIYGMRTFEYACIADIFPTEIEYNYSNIRIFYFDIETTCETGFPNMHTYDQQIISIACHSNNKYTVFGLSDYQVKQEFPCEYVKCENERELLIKFIEYYQKEDPDILSGWNIRAFDIPYLIGRIDRIVEPGYSKKLSPWEVIKENYLIENKDITLYDLLGVTILDYLEVYKKFKLQKQENYKLHNIATVELGRGKLDYSSVGSFRTLYLTDFQTFIDYNLRDVEIILELENKLKYIEMICRMAYYAKANYIDTFKQVRMWDTIIFNYLKNKNIVIPPKESLDKDEKFRGADVKDPITGMHKWICSFDVNSLYPMLIVKYNISPEKLLKSSMVNVTLDQILDQSFDNSQIKNNKLTMAANGACFLKDGQGFLPQIISDMYQKRKEYKKIMIDSEIELEKVKHELRSRGAL